MSAEPKHPAESLANKLNKANETSAAKSDKKALAHQAELKRLIEETRKSISNSQELIQQIKQDRGI